jgi:hypothetical protein
MENCIHHSGVTSEIKAIKEAVDLARTQLEKRLEGMNEFRNQLNAQAATFVSRAEIKLIMDKYETRVDLVERFYLRGEGSSKWRDIIISSIVSVAILTIAHLLFKW